MFLVNMSKSMSGSKIENAQATILKIFKEELQNKDQLGLTIFNDNYHVVFPLVAKS